MLLVTKDFPAGIACASTNLVFDRKADPAKTHKAANALDREPAVETGAVEPHPGPRALAATK